MVRRNGKGRRSLVYLAEWVAVRRPGVSQQRLAAAAGMKRQQWAELVSGGVRSPRDVTLRRVARVLGVEVDALYAPPPRRAKRR